MHRLISLLVVALWIGGCAQSNPPFVEPNRIEVTGLLSTNDTCDVFELVDLSQTRSSTPLGTYTIESVFDPWVEKYNRVRTADIVRFEVLDSDGTVDRQQYTAFLGACPAGNYAEAEFVEGTATLHLYYGWIYLVGQAPSAATDRVVTAAKGSALAVQIVPMTGNHRVYFLESGGLPARVESKLTSDKVDPWTAPNTYVEFNPAGELVLGPVDISTAPADVQATVAKLVKIRDKGL